MLKALGAVALRGVHRAVRRARGLAHLVVTFLALLELAREQLVDIAQAEPYAPIYVQLKAERGLRAGCRRMN